MIGHPKSQRGSPAGGRIPATKGRSAAHLRCWKTLIIFDCTNKVRDFKRAARRAAFTFFADERTTATIVKLSRFSQKIRRYSPANLAHPRELCKLPGARLRGPLGRHERRLPILPQAFIPATRKENGSRIG
jgi:hypothetical protein